jgi:ABC-type branched-subunit amino acid transport system ATPase component/predicted MFS family arabinose efflux permease
MPTPAQRRAGKDALVVDKVERDRAALGAAGRVAMGVTGEPNTPPMRSVLEPSELSLYPAAALSALVFVEQLLVGALVVLSPEIATALGASRSTFAAGMGLRVFVASLLALPVAGLVQRRLRRDRAVIAAGLILALVAAASAFAPSAGAVLLLVVLLAPVAAVSQVLHPTLLIDGFPPTVRVRVLSLHRAAMGAGAVAAPLLVVWLGRPLNQSWRSTLLVIAALSVLAALVSARLRDARAGAWDVEAVRRALRTDAAACPADDPTAPLGLIERTRRVLLRTTVRRVLAANVALGTLVFPFVTYLSFFLLDRWDLNPSSRALLFAATNVGALPALWVFGRRGESLFREDPARLLTFAAGAMVAAAGCLVLGALSPFLVVVPVVFGAVFAVLAVMTPVTSIATLSLVAPEMRPHAAALAGIALGGIGGALGGLVLGGLDRRFGPAIAIAFLAIPSACAALFLKAASRSINGDLEDMVGSILEHEDIRALTATGARLPMLACRHIDFSYGQLQVLFDVNITVDDGEIVALLGTNGAGKSTLLRVISGLGLPSRGTVRFHGVDATFLDAERRVGLGISQVPGGRAVFGPLTVVENLRLQGFSHGRNRRAVEVGIDASFDAFPRLAERRGQLASTLSGGEQQMLGLATALIVQPQLLLIDELSLGLAPKVVGELLETVRHINAAGTAVVLVEQSVNVALSVVNHAYFMEKGEIRFDGKAADLLARPDLLRSVFLEGASRGLTRGSALNGNKG